MGLPLLDKRFIGFTIHAETHDGDHYVLCTNDKARLGRYWAKLANDEPLPDDAEEFGSESSANVEWRLNRLRVQVGEAVTTRGDKIIPAIPNFQRAWVLGPRGGTYHLPTFE